MYRGVRVRHVQRLAESTVYLMRIQPSCSPCMRPRSHFRRRRSAPFRMGNSALARLPTCNTVVIRDVLT